MPSGATTALASRTTNATAQRVLARTPARAEMYRNPHLADDVFADLYPNKKTPARDVTELLKANVLTDAQFEHMLAFETRANVLSHLFDLGRLPAQRLTALRDAKGLSRQVADKALAVHGDTLDVPWLTVAAALGGKARLKLWLTVPEQFTDAQISADLLAATSQFGAWPDKDLVAWVLATRPGVVAAAAHSDNGKVRTLAAGSRHLTDPADQIASCHLDDAPTGGEALDIWLKEHVYALMALANNPVVGMPVVDAVHDKLRHFDGPEAASAKQRKARHPDVVTSPFEEVASPVQLAWLLQRSLPSDYKPDGRPWDMIALLANPNMGRPEAQMIGQRLEDAGLQPRQLAEAYNAFAARFEDLPTLVVRTATATLAEVGERRELVEPSAQDITTAGTGRALWMSEHDHGPAFLSRELGDNTLAWTVAAELLETQFTGTLADLVAVALATAA